MSNKFGVTNYELQFVAYGLLLSTVNCQLSTVNCQLSTVNDQLPNL